MRGRPRAWLLAAALAGCFAPAPGLPPFEAPSVGRDLRCWRGTPVSGPQPTLPLISPATPESSLQVVVRFVALEELPARGLSPLPAEETMVAALGSGTPLISVSEEARGARVGEVRDTAVVARAAILGELGRSASLGQNVAALPPGVTVAAHLSRDLTRPPGLPPSREAVALLIGRSEDGEDLEVAILVDAGPLPNAEPRGELHLLKPFRDRERLELAVVVPAPFEQDGREREWRRDEAPAPPRMAILGLISVAPAPDPGSPGHAAHQRAHAVCLGDLARARVIEERTPLEPLGLPTPPALPPRFDPMDVRRRLGDPTRARAALLELAYFSSAQLTGEAALSLDDQLATALARAISAALGVDGAPTRAGRELAWLLERATVRLLVGDPGEMEVQPTVDALLATHVGALSALPATLLATLEAAGLTAWRERVLRENLAALGEAQPAVRVRAHDWLLARDAAPAGYDPLGPLDERTAALPLLHAPGEASQ